MNEDLKIIGRGHPQFDISVEIVRHLIDANRKYTNDSTKLSTVLEAFDDLITASLSMVYESLESAVDDLYDEEDVVLANARQAIEEAKQRLVRNIELNICPQTHCMQLSTN